MLSLIRGPRGRVSNLGEKFAVTFPTARRVLGGRCCKNFRHATRRALGKTSLLPTNRSFSFQIAPKPSKATYPIRRGKFLKGYVQVYANIAARLHRFSVSACVGATRTINRLSSMHFVTRERSYINERFIYSANCDPFLSGNVDSFFDSPLPPRSILSTRFKCKIKTVPQPNALTLERFSR